MEFVYLSVGLIIGFVIAWLFFRLKQNQRIDSPIEQNPMYVQALRTVEKAQSDIRTLQLEKEGKIADLASAQTQVVALNDKINGQEQLLKTLKEQLDKDFQVLANRIFEEKSEKFTTQNRDQLQVILGPFNEKLKDFEAKVEKVYGQESEQRIDLKKELQRLMELNTRLSSDAHNLTTALKGDNKAQGNWGEFVLEKILERSGLTEGIEYFTQQKRRSVEDNEIKPDVIVSLPEERHIIIDSKVSLVAYEACISCENDDDRKRFERAHLESVRSHIKLLGDKKYETAQGLNSPDFILLFMPIEAAFSMALQSDPQLFNFAWERRIVITSPTTLLATLRTVASIWTQEKRTRNAELISTEAGKLYEKFVGFTEDLIAIGKKLDGAKEDYENAMKKLSSGPGNLVRKTEQLKQMGAKAIKGVNSKLVERAMTDSEDE
jgi:DNA recombination protein RmuC